MPHLQAVVRPRVGKNRPKSPIPQVERKAIATDARFFLIIFPLSLLKKIHHSVGHANADNRA